MGLTETQNSVRKSQKNFTSLCSCFQNSQKQQFFYDLLPKRFQTGALTCNETVFSQATCLFDDESDVQRRFKII